jgi:hypothetical protein
VGHDVLHIVCDIAAGRTEVVVSLKQQLEKLLRYISTSPPETKTYLVAQKHTTSVRATDPGAGSFSGTDTTRGAIEALHPIVAVVAGLESDDVRAPFAIELF